MPQVEGAGVALHYAERGNGPAVVVVHGAASDAEAWTARLAALDGARTIAYDRRGYGSSGAPEPYTATTVQEQAEDAATLVQELDAEPAVLVGEGFGALVVLELLVRRPGLARAAVLDEPPLLAFVPDATEALAAERERLEHALREGGPEHAVATWLGAGADPERVRRAGAAHRGFFADYGGQASWSPSRRELRGVGVPVAVVTGPATPAHLLAAADVATDLLPDARRRTDGDVIAAARALL
jgi:pimeloyl-ACP methyl ester carboxylesterase